VNADKRLLPRSDPPCRPGVRDQRSPRHPAQRSGRANLSSCVGLRAVALFEAAKGGIVLAAGLGALELLGNNAQKGVEELVRHFHLDPASRYPRILLLVAQQATPDRLWALAACALAYATVRFAEAYGLWHGRAWAEWFAVLSGSIYLPLEVWQLAHRATWTSVTVLTVNLAIVGYIGWTLVRTRAQQTPPGGA
jgi:uncharacterized membrane protein (DUF2068 family)